MSRRLLLCWIFDSLLFPFHRKRPNGLRILQYHGVGNRGPEDAYGMTVGKDAFGRQMRLLLETGRWNVTDMESGALHRPAADPGGLLSVAVTFDDGYRSVLENAAPLLLDLGVPFALFVTVEWMLSGRGAFMSVSDLRELAANPGVRIGSHGLRHRPMTDLGDDDLKRELVESRKRLQDDLGVAVHSLSYPHGRATPRVLNAARSAGYRFGAGSRYGVNDSSTDDLFLRRTEIWDSDTDRTFINKCTGSWDGYAGYQRLRGL